jgi:DNA-binding response OmpR family regulator
VLAIWGHAYDRHARASLFVLAGSTRNELGVSTGELIESVGGGYRLAAPVPAHEDPVNAMYKLSVGDLTLLDWHGRTWCVNGQTVGLSPIEHRLLAMLVFLAGYDVPWPVLKHFAWVRNPDRVTDQTLNVRIAHLRRQLGPDAPAIKPVYGAGAYVLVKPA